MAFVFVAILIIKYDKKFKRKENIGHKEHNVGTKVAQGSQRDFTMNGEWLLCVLLCDFFVTCILKNRAGNPLHEW